MIFIFVLIALFLAMNVGANNSAAEMGAACGTGSRTQREALTLIAIFVILGAIIAGLPVLRTLGAGLVPARVFKGHIYVVFVVMIVSAVFDLISNRFRVSIPNSYAIVSSIAAAGIYYKVISVDKSAMILKWWLLSPIVAFAAAFIVGKLLRIRISKLPNGVKVIGRTKSFLVAMLTFSGCYVAFAGGANGAAKAMAPIVAAGIIDSRWGLLIGGAGIAAGALIFGRAALETADKEIIEIGFVRAILIELICATVLLAASFNGAPLSVSVTVTSGLIGLGCADLGFLQSAKRHHLLRTCCIWLFVPLLSIGLTYFLLHILAVILK